MIDRGTDGADAARMRSAVRDDSGHDARIIRTRWDQAQRAVIDLDSSASGVVAGAPGTGKTSTVIARVAALVERGVEADSILVITPSRQTATALRDTLALTVGRATTGPMARSLSSFAFQLVRAHEVHAGREPPQLLTGPDEDKLVHDMLDGDADDERHGAGRWPESLGIGIRATQGFRTDLRAFIAECTTLGIEPDRLRQLGETQSRAVWVSLSSFFAEYLQVRADMRGTHRDAAGLVREAVGILRLDPTRVASMPGVLADGGVMLVDDAQELTLGGVELVEACAARGIAVLAFGDPDIGSGAFRGATPANFARLARSLGKVFVLPQPHRGNAAQADLIRRVTGHIGAVGVVAHRTPPVGAEPDESISTYTLRSASEEFDVIARLLRERHVHDGVPWGGCAVIAHDSRQVASLEAELVARDVPAKAVGAHRALGTLRPVRDLLRLIDLGLRESDTWHADEIASVLLGVGGGFDPVDLRRFRTTLRHAELALGSDRTGGELLASGMMRPLEFDLVDTREARRAARIARTLEAVRVEHARGATVHELLWTVWDRSRLAGAWGTMARGSGPLAEQANRDLDAVVAVFESAKRFVERGRDADPRAFVRSILDSDVAEDRLEAAPPHEAVRVLTPAGALGTQFDTVVVAGVQDRVWPNTRLRGGLLHTWRLAEAASAGDAASSILDRRRTAMHDELRLFVRAISRASSRLIVTAVDDDDTGPSVFFEFLPAPRPITRAMEHPLSLRGLVALHRRTLTDRSGDPHARERAAEQLVLLADASVPGAAVSQWYGIAVPTSSAPLRDLAREDVRVSPSRLHTLEECQLNWVIGDLGGDAGSTTAGIGTIIHSALEHADGADEAELWAAVDARWSELTFEAEWRDRAERAKARDLVRRLHLYLRRFEQAGGTLIGAEPHFEVPIDLGTVEESDHRVILSGYIDRVERESDGSVVIVDLKTGKSEPQTDAKVSDNPQLAAYQLAFESGTLTSDPSDRPGGAMLLVLRPSAKAKDYVTPRQPPLDDERREAFVARIRDAVTVMRGTAFRAPYEEHCRDEHSYGLCRIHTISAVSAS